jgi:hypothetical protein
MVNEFGIFSGTFKEIPDSNFCHFTGHFTILQIFSRQSRQIPNVFDVIFRTLIFHRVVFIMELNVTLLHSFVYT